MYIYIIPFVLIGFFAEIIDGVLGMGYGVISSSMLIGAGLSPLMASATVHLSEIFVSAASGISHLRFGNVEKSLFIRLLLPGLAGAITGAFLLINLPGEKIKPFVAIYLLAIGIVILYRSISKKTVPVKESGTGLLALTGGFFDAIGGGGWGPIVTSTLLTRGYEPKKVIGSVNLAEFFITVTQGGIFVSFVKDLDYKIVLAMIAGGVISAPFAAYLCRKIPPSKLMLLIGLLIIILSIRTISLSVSALLR